MWCVYVNVYRYFEVRWSFQIANNVWPACGNDNGNGIGRKAKTELYMCVYFSNVLHVKKLFFFSFLNLLILNRILNHGIKLYIYFNYLT